MRSENASSLEKFHPDLYAALSASSRREDLKVVPSRRGLDTLVRTDDTGRQKFVHSPVDPVGEAEKLAPAALRSSGGVPARRALLVGHGAGYEIRALSARLDDLQVLVSDLRLLAFVCDHFDLSDIFSNPRVRWVHGSMSAIREKLRAWAAGDSAGSIQTILHPPFVELIPPECAELLDAIDQLVQGRNTEDLLEPLARENFQKNIPALSAPGVSRLANLSRGRPTLVVGAGPSLDHVVEDLRRMSAVSRVIAVDTIAEGLTEFGVIPDFVISVDPREDSLLHFTDDRNLSGSCLVFTPITHPEVVRRFVGRRFLAVPRSHFFLKSAEQALSAKGVLMGGGSVSILASSLGIFFEPLFVGLAGVDFGVERSGGGRDIRFYSRLSSYVRRATESGSRYMSSETTEYDILKREIRKSGRESVEVAPRLRNYSSEFRHLVKDSMVPFYSFGPPPVAGVRSGVWPCGLPTDSPSRPVPIPPDSDDPGLVRACLQALGLAP